MNKRVAIALTLKDRVTFIYIKAVAIDNIEHFGAADVARSADNIRSLRAQTRNLIGVAREELQRLEDLCRD